MDPTDLYANEFDGDTSTLLDEATHQVTYHREQLMYWRRLVRKLESTIPKTPVEELLETAEAAWSA